MEPVVVSALITALVTGLANLAAHHWTEGLVEKWRNRLRSALEEDNRLSRLITNRMTLQQQLEWLAADTGRIMRKLGIKEPLEKALFELVSDPLFRHDLAEWLLTSDQSEIANAKQQLENQMAYTLEKSGANDTLIASFRSDFFNILENVIFEDEKLAHWRHYTILQTIRSEQNEILLRSQEGDGEYSQVRKDKALEHYRKIALKFYDIIDLTGLPVASKELASRKLALRHLYIPLRLEAEGSTGLTNDKTHGALRKWEAQRESKRLILDMINRVSIGELLRENQRLVVLGDPGSGKTTLIRWLTTAYLLRMKDQSELTELADIKTLPRFKWFPIIIQCRNLAEDCHCCALEELFRPGLNMLGISEHFHGPLLALFREHLESGTALLMVDGLDEIQDITRRLRFCRRLEKISELFDKAPILITSRLVGYREMRIRFGGDFKHATLSDLTPSEVDNFAWYWAYATSPQDRRDAIYRALISGLHSSERVRLLACNPMLLTTLVLVHSKIGNLPQRRVDLYEEALQVLLNWRSDVNKRLEWLEAVPQLEFLAYIMCRDGLQQLSKDRILAAFKEMRHKYENLLHDIENHSPTKFLNLLEERSNILVMVGEERQRGDIIPLYEFRHLTFQEYLAGLALVNGRFPGFEPSLSIAERIKPLIEFIRDGDEWVISDNWRESLRLCLPYCRDKEADEAILAILRPAESEDSGITARPRAVMAALCLADEPNISQKVAIEVLQCLAKKISENIEPYEPKSTAWKACLEVGRSRWSTDLRRILAVAYCKEKENIRSDIAALCGEVRSAIAPEDKEKFIEWLSEELNKLNPIDDITAIEFAMMLSQAKYPSKLDDLTSINHNQTANAKLSFSSVLVKIIAVLKSMLQRSIHSKYASLCALNRLKYKNGISLISEYDIRNLLVQEISEIEINDFTKPLIIQLHSFLGWCAESRILDLLERHSMHPDPDIRSSAIRGSAWFFDSPISDQMLQMFQDTEPSVRSAVAFMLGPRKDKRALNILHKLADDPHPYVRFETARALSRGKGERVLDLLMQLLDDPEALVRGTAATSLRHLDLTRLVDQLSKKSDDPDSRVRLTVACALEKGANSRHFEIVKHLAGDSDSEVRLTATKALGNLGDSRSITPLIARFSDSDWQVRMAAVEAFEKLGDSSSVESLLALLEDSNFEGCESAIYALGKLKDPRAVGPLIQFLDDPDPYIRLATARALGGIGDTNAIVPLRRHLHERLHIIRNAVMDALITCSKLDDISKRLLYSSPNNVYLKIDPIYPVSNELVSQFSQALNLSETEIRRHYEILAPKFGLTLEWLL